MNSATRRSLMAAAEQKAQNYPAEVRRPLAQGTRRYQKRLWAIHGAVIILATLLLGAGLLTARVADSPPETTAPPVEPGPINTSDPSVPAPIESPEPPDPTLVDIDLFPSSLPMTPGEQLPVEAWGIYNNGSQNWIPAPQLSWDVIAAEGQSELPAIASVDSTTGTVTAISTGDATLTVTTQDIQATAPINISTPGRVTPSPGATGGVQRE